MGHPIRSILSVGFCLVAAFSPIVADEIPAPLRKALERPLDARVEQLKLEENDAGVNNVRGSYKKQFRKIDDDSYEVVFHKRTAGRDSLHIARYRFTLRRADEEWTIADETLETEFADRFFRSVPGDETFHAFDTFAFEREGITLSSGPGTMVVDSRPGQARFLRLRGADLAQAYQPPAATEFGALFEIVEARYPDDVAFAPAEVSISCAEIDCSEILASSFANLREVTIDALDSTLREDYEEGQRELVERRSEDAMSGFSRVARPGNHWWTVGVKRQGKDHWIQLAYDDLDPREVTFWVGGKGTLYEYPAEESRGRVTVDELERRADRARMDYDIVSLSGRVDMALDGPEAMQADLVYRLRIHQPLDLLHFSIANVGAFRDDNDKDETLSLDLIADGEGEELTFIKTGGTTGYILFPETLPAGNELKLHVKYRNDNGIYKLNAHYSYVSRSGWLPFVQFGDMIDDYDLTFRAPGRYTILGVGRQESTTSDGRTTTTRFVASSPVQFPTVIFGSYEKGRSKIEVKHRDGTIVPVNVYVDEYSMSSAGWDIRANALQPVADEAANSLNLFQEILGLDYPHEKLDVVNAVFQSPLSGQSPASIVYLGGAKFRGTGAVAQAYVDSGGISKFMETLVAHEVGHQWWGGTVAHSNWRNYWFVESLAEYMAALYVENLYAAKDPVRGWQKYLEKVGDWRRNILGTDLMASVQDSDSMWQGELRGAARKVLIYDYGPFAFHILRMTFRDYQGESGDSRFFGFLSRLAKELAGREIVTSDIQGIAESAFGGVGPDGTPYHADMGWFFDQWIRGVGIPELTLDYESRQAEDGNFIVQGTIRQRILVGQARDLLPDRSFRGIVLVKVDAGKQEFRVPVALNGPETPFGFKVPLKPRYVTINDNFEMLAYDVQ